MKNFYRIMLGPKSIHAKEAFKNNFIGAGWLENIDFTGQIPESWREFNKKYIPIYLEQNPQKTKVSAGLACGMLHTIIKGIQSGDIILSPDGEGNYFVGEVIGEYEYKKDQNLPHRRPIKWFTDKITRDEISDPLKNSMGSIGTVSNISKHSDEVEALMEGKSFHPIIAIDETIEDPSTFALETHLEDFLIHNWDRTELGKKYNIFTEDGEMVGQQYLTDTGPIDILAISKDGKELLVLELKKGRASDFVLGQIQRYMGFVKDELAEKDQAVRGAIIAFEDDTKIRRALSVASNIEFYTYKINFELERK